MKPTNIKLIKLGILILLLMQWQLSPSQAAIGAKYSFEMDPNGFYQMTGQVEAPLVWPESTSSTINVSITIDNLPNDNISGITIVAINFILQTSRDNNESILPETDSIIINKNFKNESETITFSRDIEAPTLADEFVVRIEILAITTGNITQDINDPPAYSFFFPDEPGSIFVERSQARALINLYGFPPTSYMLVFGMMVLGLSSPMLIPVLISSGFFFKDWLETRKQKKNENPEEEQTEKSMHVDQLEGEDSEQKEETS